MKTSRFVLPLLVALVACESTEPRCDPVRLFGIRAFIRDSVSGDGVARAALAVIRDGMFEDSLTTVSDSVKVGADERAGTYRLEVSAPGYQNWARNGIVVAQASECHVQTVDVTVRLVPATPASAR